MMTSYSFSFWIVTVVGFGLMTGCASVQFDDYLEDPATQRAQVENRAIHPESRSEAAVPDLPAKCGWNCVTYRGEVVSSQGPGGPVAQARVAMVEGKEELCRTVTDSQGRFELACDLYGKPFTSEDGVCRWCPEEYYALIATGPDGGKGKVILKDTPCGGRVRIPLD